MKTKQNTKIKDLLLIGCCLVGFSSAEAAEPKATKTMKALKPVKVLNKVEVKPVEKLVAQEYALRVPASKSVQFKVQKLKSVEANNRGWTTAYPPLPEHKHGKVVNPYDPKLVALPPRFESLALKDQNLAHGPLAEEYPIKEQPMRVLTEKEERMLAAKILAAKDKCFISIGLWKTLKQDDEAMLCLVHDKYDDVALMNLKNPKSEEAEMLLSRLSSLQIKLVDEAIIKNSFSIPAKIILAYEKNNHKEVLEKTEGLAFKKENYKLFLLRVLSLSNLNKNEDALYLTQDLEKFATPNELTVLHVLKARLYLKMQKPNEAMLAVQQMPKEHPLWLESMQDLGWAQLQGQDFSGAIGNMYSLHTPYFRFVYQPQSYVVRTIGYLNLCQYGDAYRSLTEGEVKAQAWSTLMQKPQPLSGTVKSYIQTQSSTQKWPLPIEVLRELARNRSFINLQKEINRLVDSQNTFKSIETRLVKIFTDSKERAAKDQKELKKIVEDLRKAKSLNHLAEAERLERRYNFHQESYYSRLFEYQLAKNSLEGFQGYWPVVNKNYSDLYANYEQQIEGILQKRYKEMNKELAHVIDQNEFLRYEIFAGSGEDIRYQAAGGAIEGPSGRLPASYRPSKSLQWTFDGEIWEDEIGNYRSSLINNCPKLEKAMKANDKKGVEDDQS